VKRMPWASAAWRRERRRHSWLDHLVRAATRYDQADGGRLAAAVTYYAFFATFALGLFAFAIFGFVLDDPTVFHSAQGYLAVNLSTLDLQALRGARHTVGVIAFIGLPITGWLWVDALRSSIRCVWRLPEYPGTLVVRVLVDLLVMVGLGLLLAASLTAAMMGDGLASRLVNTNAEATGLLPAALGTFLGVGVNLLLAIAVLTAVPRLRMPVRRVIGPALLLAVALELLKGLGQIYVRQVEANPTYQIVAGGAVALLVTLNIVNQLILFAATLTATSTDGHVADLTSRRGLAGTVPIAASATAAD
jgi:membrane protein